MRKKKRPLEIREFIIDNVSSHPRDISRITAAHFGVSRPAVVKHIQGLVRDGLLVATGKTKARHYALKELVSEWFTLDVTPRLEEDAVWRDRILPLLKDIRENVLSICYYGFTEMLNNVIDHSGSKSADIWISRNAAEIRMDVVDRGIGVFNKIQSDFNLSDPRHALLELSKGKLTSDKERHTGEGIFFTSRMFDKFVLSSGTLSYCRFKKDDDWLLEIADQEPVNGTHVTMTIRTRTTRTQEEIFKQYASELHDFGFTRTHVPLELLRYEGEQLLSRSQAKRLLARVDQFKEVFLDFRGITTIGQAFADEIFRVFRKERPNVTVVRVNTTEEIEQMIRRVESGETIAS